jgi:gas vesicle protein
MADSYDRYDMEDRGGSGFLLGLVAGTVLGAGLGMLLAPKAGTELRGNISEQAKNFGTKASEQYRRASESAGEWAEKGRGLVEKAKGAVNRGAEEARSYAGGSASTYGTPSTGSAYGSTTGTTGSGDFGRS